MQVVIRVDSSIELGTGHVMRCITLGKQLREKGANVYYICRNFIGNSINLILLEGFKVFILEEVIDKNTIEWTRDNWKKDSEDTIRVLRGTGIACDLLIVDHYGIDNKWEKNIKDYVNTLMVIDDTADREHVCDILLDQNYYLCMENRYEGLVPNNCCKLLGPNYLLLREEFLSINPDEICRDGKLEKILIFFGGTDPSGETLKTIKALKDFQSLELNVVVGAQNPLRDVIKRISMESKNISFHLQVSNMAKMMLEADLAIGAGGTTTWERCFLKLPSITTIIAKNQQQTTNSVAVKRAIINLGFAQEVSEELIKGHVTDLINDQAKLKEMAGNCAKIVDNDRVRDYLVVNKIMELGS